MNKRVSLSVVAALALTASCNKGDSSPGPASGVTAAASASAGSGTGTGTGMGTGAGTGTGSGSGSAAVASGAGPALGPDGCPLPPKTPIPDAVTAKLAKPFFFAATKPGFGHLWLFGTMHIGVAPDAIPDAVLGKIEKSERFAMEADLSDLTTLFGAIMRTDGKTLSDELGPQVWHEFECAVGEKQAGAMQHMKASVAATLLDAQGLAPTTPMDLFLEGRAQKAGKEVIFLEPAVKQLALLDKWMDARAIKESLEDAEDGRQKNLELITAYVAGDADKAIAMSKDDSDFVKEGRSHADFVQFMKELALDRNASWIPEIEDMAKKGDAFVAVGALHLLGDGSVVDLLGKDGWTVTRVTP
jgi:uncharacterized protein YbaP (TraB family)